MATFYSGQVLMTPMTTHRVKWERKVNGVWREFMPDDEPGELAVADMWRYLVAELRRHEQRFGEVQFSVTTQVRE